MTDKETDIEIDRCLKLIIVDYNGTAFVSHLCNQEFPISDQSPTAIMIAAHMEECNLVTRIESDRKCIVTKLGSEIYHNNGGWLTYKRKLKNKKRWDKFLQLVPILIALTSIVWNIITSQKIKEQKIINQRVDTLFQEQKIVSQRTDSLIQTQKIINQRVDTLISITTPKTPIIK